MRILWNDLRIGDEIIIPSNSNMKYLKVLKKNKKFFTCSMATNEEITTVLIWNGKPWTKQDTLVDDLTKHNGTFFLKDEGDYRDIWLVKREDNGFQHQQN